MMVSLVVQAIPECVTFRNRMTAQILCFLFNIIQSFSVHPRYKHDVGYRLSRSGLAVAYGQHVEFQGPLVQNVVYLNGSSTVNITYTTVSSIELRNPNGFEV